jgi:rhodanese-related sulfurtransferase
MSISVKTAVKMIAQNATNPKFKVVDVRTAAERAVSSIPNSSHIPLGDLEQSLSKFSPEDTYLIYCRSGVRSGKASALLNTKGFTAINMEGGIIEWEKEHGSAPQQKSEGGWCKIY